MDHQDEAKGRSEDPLWSDDDVALKRKHRTNAADAQFDEDDEAFKVRGVKRLRGCCGE